VSECGAMEDCDLCGRAFVALGAKGVLVCS